MTSGRPHLASWAQRLTALTVDSFIMFVLFVLLVGAMGSEPSGNGAVPALLLLLLGVPYHAAGVHNARLSFGRTIVGVAVVPITGGGEVTRLRAVWRALVRIGVATLAAFWC
jgi:hypothetical protein